MFDWVAVPVVHDDDSTANAAAAMAVIQNAVIFIMRVFLQIRNLHHQMQIYEKLRAEAKFTLILPKRISICARSANIAKVECRGKIYFHYAETQAYICPAGQI